MPDRGSSSETLALPLHEAGTEDALGFEFLWSGWCPQGGNVATVCGGVTEPNSALEAQSQEAAGRLVECLEAPWAYRIKRALREDFDPDEPKGEESTRELEARTRELGLQPRRAPEPLPPIDGDEIRLVVWMAVEMD